MFVALIAAVSMYYLQVYAFYEDPQEGGTVSIVNVVTGESEEIIADSC